MLIAGALASAGTACNTVDTTKEDPTDTTADAGTTDPTEDTPTQLCLEADCPIRKCAPKLTIRRADLEYCYGFTNGVWSGNTPNSVKNCDGQAAAGTTGTCTCAPNDVGIVICTFTDGSPDQYPLVTPQCQLGTVNQPVDASLCTYDDPDMSGIEGIFREWDQDQDGYLDCGLVPTEDPKCDVVSNVTLGAVSCDSCATGAAARIVRPSGTNATLSLDPAKSYLAVTTPLQSLMVRLSGEAFVDLQGNRLLGMKISAERVRFGSSDWNGFRFSLDKPVPFTRAGEAFRIPVAQKPTITAAGQRDGAPLRLRASSAADVTGHVSVAHKTWDLDFADKSAAGSFALHLAGRVAQ